MGKNLQSSGKPYPFYSLGMTANVLSSIMTLVIGFPVLIIILFFVKNAQRNFSIYDSFRDYFDGEISKEVFLKKISRRKLVILLFGIPISAILIGIIISEFEHEPNVIFLLAGIIPFIIFYILCIKIKRYINAQSQPITEY